MRFTLSKMFVAVAMLALAFAGMFYRNRWWTDAIVTVSIGLFVLSGIWAISLRGRKQASTFGFAIIGACYLLVSTSAIRLGSSLPTNYPLAALAAMFSDWATLPGGSAYLFTQPEEIGTFSRMMDWQTDSDQSLGQFFIIGHCVFSWIFAVLAAWFAGRMYDQRIAKEANQK